MRRLLVPLALGFGIAQAGTAGAETLEQALTETYSTNPQILSERANLRATDEGVPQALSGWRPTVTFTGSEGYQNQQNAPEVLPNTPGHQNLEPNTVDLTSTLPLYQGGMTVAKTAQAEDSVEAERARNIATESVVLFSVIQAYFDVIRDSAVVDLDKNNEQVLARQLDATNDEFRVGQVTRTDVAQAESRLAAATATRQTDQGQLAVSRANYTRAVGHPPGPLVQPTLHPVIPASREEALTLAATKNPNVIAALFTEQAARDNVAATKAQLLPSLALVTDVNRSFDTVLRGRETANGSVVARLTMPLYEAGNIWSQSRQAVEAVGYRQGQTDDQRAQAVQAATSAWETIQSARATIISLQSTIRAAEIALEGVRQQQLVGARTVLDVLNAEQELFSDRTSLVRSQHDLAVAEFNLAVQVGHLSAADLALPVKLYDVNAHYKSIRNKWLGFGAKDQ